MKFLRVFNILVDKFPKKTLSQNNTPQKFATLSQIKNCSAF